MDRCEIEKELRMTYEELCKYLQGKYGIAKVNYFPNEECRARNKKVSRTNEGLFCHHIYEKFGGSNLCHPSMARQYPYEYQKRENLVYCNYLEHLLLHLKINISSDLIMNKPLDVKRFFNSDGFSKSVYSPEVKSSAAFTMGDLRRRQPRATASRRP